MRVCLVTPEYPPCPGGVATGIQARLPGLQVNDVTGTLLTLEYDGTSRSDSVAGFSVKRLRRPHGRNRWGPLDAVQAFLAVLRWGREAHVIHVSSAASSFSIGASLAAVLLRKPWILEPTLLGSDDPISASRRRIGCLHRWLFRRADAINCLSSAIASKVVEFGLPMSRVVRVPYAVDADLFRPVGNQLEKSELRDALGLPRDRVIVQYVGGINERKGLHILVEALGRFAPRANLPFTVVMGAAKKASQEYACRVLDQVRELGLQDDTLFVGQITDRGELARLMRCGDLFVLLSDREGFPNASLEAMASGLCSLLARIPGITDDIGRDGDNCIVVNRNADDVSRALQMCALDSELRARIGHAARHTILDGYTSEKLGKRYAGVYEQICRSRS